MAVDPLLHEVVTGFADAVAGEFTREDVLQRLAHSAVRVLGVDGAGVMVPEDDRLLRFSHATGPATASVTGLDLLQERLQDGPCQDSWTSGEVVEVADLAVSGDWPQFQELAVREGLRAVTSIPLLARGQRWGVLELYRSEPGLLSADELDAARTLARVATSYLVVTADRDTARRAQQELAYRAMHDPLTGLPVRWVFLEQLGHAVAGLARQPGNVAVVFVDIDGLKYVNDTHGHDAGDRLLRTCVERIRAALRPTDVVARLGGDEFVVMLEDLDGNEDAATVARRVLAGLAEPYPLGSEVLTPSASLGIALTDDPDTSSAGLIAHADNAMYRAKRAGRGQYAFFDAVGYSADREDATARGSTAAALRAALRTGQLRLQYQPVVALGVPPSVHALEALVRWDHPDRGLVPAAEFVRDAEVAGVMADLGAWVLAESCAQLARWDEALGGTAPGLFVNVSTDELGSADLPERLRDVLRRTGVTPERVTLEITETGLLGDVPEKARTVSAVTALGVGLAIDDFGTGYSSLSRLVELPAGTWKVDRSLTRGLADAGGGTRSTAAAVVAAVLRLGRQLRRTVVVEGVEDEETLARLRDLGCTHAQGHHLGRPLDPDRVLDLLREGAR